ncbi:MAG: dephospho-CoA kinase [Calditrichales bacterium]|nr:dephospho-CoA kinase [Calditrichales bacterium]
MRRQYHNPLVAAVTGGIGSGQSTVCSFLKKRQCKVVNADLKAKEVIRKDRKLQNKLKTIFGNDIFINNGELNRQRLADLAFKDEFHTHKLNQLVHPRMVESIIEEMENARFSKRFPIVIVDAALIYEISIEKMFDVVIVVNAPLNLRQKRVIERDNITRKQFKDRLDKQIPLEEKVKWADFVIENNSTLEDLENSTHKVHQELIKMQRGMKRIK